MAASPGEGTRASLAERVRDPGYTPGIRDLSALLELFGGDDEDLVRAAEKAVLRIEMRHAVRLVSETTTHASAAERPARGRLARLVGRIASADGAADGAAAAARTWLMGALADDDIKTRHTAARALGKLRPANAVERTALEAALLAAWDAARGDDDRRSLVDALGKVGSKAARERLAKTASAPLAQQVTRAALIIDRTESREKPGAIDLARRPEAPLAVRFHARSGLEVIVAEELGEAWRPRVAGSGLVDARLEGPLAGAVAIRTALHVGFPLDSVPVREELAEAVVRAILDPRALSILRTFTATDGGPIRFRLAWIRGGHRRALAWRCAELVAAETAELVNDPTGSTWEIVVDDYSDRVSIELVPRGFLDERFAYRQKTVSASSHPTIAAALARMTPQDASDVVWDPFVGAGAELVERARLGPYARLIGTDLESAAIDAARTNLAAAGIRGATLNVADGTIFEARAPSVIITNPPMGRRVQRGTHGELLERFVDHAAKLLVPGGALVWAVPDARKLHERAARAGLALERALTVDMGGFPAELSVHRKGVV